MRFVRIDWQGPAGVAPPLPALPFSKSASSAPGKRRLSYGVFLQPFRHIKYVLFGSAEDKRFFLVVRFCIPRGYTVNQWKIGDYCANTWRAVRKPPLPSW